MSKKAIPLTEKEEQAIKIYLEQRLGQYGVKAYLFKLEETPRLTYDYRLTQKLNLNGIGIFKFALSEVDLYTEIWAIPKQENECYQRHIASVHLNYNHIGGGSNGCECSLKLYTDETGTIRESYK